MIKLCHQILYSERKILIVYLEQNKLRLKLLSVLYKTVWGHFTIGFGIKH
jgi:hypothetical protein